jgi:molecular chaperone DnaK (HSP70)
LLADHVFLFSFIDRQIPTVLSYVDGEEYYGQQAKNFLVRNSKNTVAYFKDLLGKEYVRPPRRPYRLSR